jgi:hypothetical protein
MEGGGNVQVGGVSFSIGVDLSSFEKNLTQAEQIAKQRAGRIQQALGNIPAAEQVQEVVVKQRRRKVVQEQSAQQPAAAPPPLPAIQQTQEVVVNQKVKVNPPTSGDVQRAVSNAAQQTQAQATNVTGNVNVSPKASAPTGPTRSVEEIMAERNRAIGITPLSERMAAEQPAAPPTAALQAVTNPLVQALEDAIQRTAPSAPIQSGLRSARGLAAGGADVETILGVLNQMAAPRHDVAAIADILGAGKPAASAGLSDRERLAAYRQDQATQERNARLESRPYSVIRTGRQVGLTDTEAYARQADEAERRFGRQFRAAQEQQVRDAQAAMGPHELPANVVTPFRRGRGLTPTGEFDIAAAQRTAAQQARQAAQNTRQQQAAMGPFEMAPSVISQFRRERGLTGYGDQPPPRPPGGGGGGGFGSLFSGANNPTTQARALLELVAGVGLRFGLLVGAARLFHEALVQSIESATQLAQATRNVGIGFGSASQAIRGPGATAFMANNQVAGTQQQYLQAAAGLAPLAQQYGLTTSQVNQLITASGQLARIHGVELPQAMQAVEAVMQGNLDAAHSLDIELTDQYGIIRNVGLTWQQLVQAQGPAAARSTLLAAVLQDTSRQMQNSAQQSDDLSKSLDTLARAQERVASGFANVSHAAAVPIAGAAASTVTNPTQAAGNVATGALMAAPLTAGATVLGSPALTVVGSALLARAAVGAGQQAAQRGELQGPAQVVAQASGPLEGIATAIQGTSDAIQRGANALDRIANRLPGPLQGAAQGASGALGVAANAASSAAGGVATLGQAAPSPLQQQQQAASRELAVQRNNQRLQALNTAPLPTPLSTAEANRVVQQQRNLAEAQNAADRQRQAGIQQQAAQARLAEISGNAQLRQLDVQQQINDLAATRIEIENQLAPLLLRQQAIQDQIAIRTQENLTLVQNTLEARRRETVTGAGLENVSFAQKQAQLRAQVSMSQLVQGQRPSFDLGQQFNQYLSASLARPALELNDAEAQHTLNQAQFAQTVDELTKGISVIPLREQAQLIERQTTMLNEQLAATQGATDVINRALEFANILADPARIEAERNLTNALIAEAQAAQTIIGIQGQNGGPQITNSITIVNPTPQDQSALIDQLKVAATAGTLDAINAAATSAPTRVDSTVAAGR